MRNNLLEFDNYFSQTMNEKLLSFEHIMSGAYNSQKDRTSYEIAHKMTPIEDSDTKFWDGLISYLNYKNDGVIDKIVSEFPQLTKSDINFIGLMCCGFSDAAIAVCKRYRNTASVRSKKRQIRDKMKIQGTLADYIKNITE